MSLKLIRKAQIATTKNPEILVAEHVRAVLNQMGIDAVDVPVVKTKKTVVEASMDIDKTDYDRWMGVVHDTAAQSGMSITKKSQLADIAMSVLDNDPKIESQPGDKEMLKSHIVDTLWNAHKATISHARVTTSVKKAKEEEEMSGFGQAFRQANGVEDEQTSAPLVKGALAAGPTNPYPTGSLRHALWNKMHGGEENEEFGAEAEHPLDDTPPADVGADDMDDSVSDDAPDQLPTDDEMDAGDDAPHGADDMDPDAELEDDVDGEGDPDDLLSSLSTEELEAELAKRQGEDGDDEAVDGDDVDADADPEADVDADPEATDDVDAADVDPEATDKAPADLEKTDESESADDIAKRVFDDEESTKNFFRTAISRPADELKQAIASIEDEGRKAGHELPEYKNPHPAKSHAWKAHMKGFIAGVKDRYGIKDPKPAATSKQKKRR